MTAWSSDLCNHELSLTMYINYVFWLKDYSLESWCFITCHIKHFNYLHINISVMCKPLFTNYIDCGFLTVMLHTGHCILVSFVIEKNDKLLFLWAVSLLGDLGVIAQDIQLVCTGLYHKFNTRGTMRFPVFKLPLYCKILKNVTAQ